MNKIPISIGIVGHGDAVIPLEHQEKILQIFYDISTRYPHSPVVLFSQLAMGADTEVTKMFLDFAKKNNRNFRLIVPIPYDIDYFKKTQFHTNEELEIFNGLLNRSERNFTLNKLSDETKEILDNDINANIDELNEYYRLGGEFVADSSIVLIVIWNEKDNKLQGGTANIVQYKKTGSYQKFISENIFDTQGSLISIPCNREGENNLIILKDNYLNALLTDESIKKVLDKIEELNIAGTKIDTSLINRSADFLFPPKNKLDNNNDYLKRMYALADVQANGNQIRYNRILKGLFILGFVIFSFFEAYQQLGLKQELFYLTIILIVVAVSVFKFSYNWKNHKKYIENRVLAEALRIQFFWNISKIRKSVSKFILRIHKKEYFWIKHILLAIYGVTYPDDASDKVSISNIKKYWLNNQKQYFKDKVKKLEENEKKYKTLSYIIFGFGLLVLVITYWLNLNYEHHKWLHPLVLFDSIIFGVFAIMQAYYEKKGYEQIKRQYSLMQSIYSAAGNKIDEIDSLNKDNEAEEVDNTLFLTGKEALSETGNWFMIYKDKTPELKGIG